MTRQSAVDRHGEKRVRVSLFSEDAATAELEARSRDRRVGWTLLALTLFGVVALAILPSPYVIERPGPVFDTLDAVSVDGEDVPLIDIPTEPTYDTPGSLALLTVNVVGNRDSRPSWFDVLQAWIDPTQAVVPVDSVFPEGVSTEDRREQSRVDMQNSQREAVAAALRALGEPYESSLVVVESMQAGPAEGVLEPDDVIVSVNGTAVRDVTALRELISVNGTGGPAEFLIVRGGAEQTALITPVLSDGQDRVPIIGVLVAGEYEFPFEVEIELSNVGGPSAGMMFALGIVDKLTPGSLAGGAEVAGTGTIAADGAVGPIGGIQQKMYGAVDFGADWFLAPAANCGEVVGAVPDGLEVFSVATLDDAIVVLQTIADEGDLDALPRCDA